MTHDDYDSWKSIRSSAISTDGNWVLYLEIPQDGDGALVVKDLKTMKEYRYSIGYTGEGTESHRAANPQFSYDTRHVVFLIFPSKAEVKESKKKKEDYGSPFVIRSLEDGSETQIDDVFSYRFTKNGNYLLYIVSSKLKPETDGVYSFRPGNESGTPLLTGKGKYKRWAMDEKETVLAFLTDRDDQEADEPTFNLYGWKVGEEEASLWVSHNSTDGIPEGMAVSDKSNISFSDNGKVVLFGIKEIPEPKNRDDEAEGAVGEKDDEEEEKAKFDLWHRNTGPFLGRLSGHLHDHPDEHFRCCRSRSAGLQHDQHLWWNQMGKRYGAAISI